MAGKKVVFLGAKDIGLECLKILHEQQERLNYQIVGVLTNSRGVNVKEYCRISGLPILNSLNDYMDVAQIDIAISIQYHEILTKNHIDKVNEIIVNLHMAPLPDYRGCNQFSFAIIDQVNEFGTTIHRLEEGIDDGAILFEKRFPIPPDIWVEDLYNLTFTESIALFENNLGDLVSGKYSLIDQRGLLRERGTSFHYRKEIETIKRIDLDWPQSKIERHIRATYHQQFKPPYTIIGGRKVYFSLKNQVNLASN